MDRPPIYIYNYPIIIILYYVYKNHYDLFFYTAHTLEISDVLMSLIVVVSAVLMADTILYTALCAV
jgi:hypothetical protein